jgi:hypothetical protein
MVQCPRGALWIERSLRIGCPSSSHRHLPPERLTFAGMNFARVLATLCGGLDAAPVRYALIGGFAIPAGPGRRSSHGSAPSRFGLHER